MEKQAQSHLEMLLVWLSLMKLLQVHTSHVVIIISSHCNMRHTNAQWGFWLTNSLEVLLSRCCAAHGMVLPLVTHPIQIQSSRELKLSKKFKSSTTLFPMG